MKLTTVLVICELSTLKCDKHQFCKFLNYYSNDVTNVNDYLWIVKNYQIPDTPFDNDINNILNDLKTEGYATENTNCISIIPDSVSGFFYGIDMCTTIRE